MILHRVIGRFRGFRRGFGASAGEREPSSDINAAFCACEIKGEGKRAKRMGEIGRENGNSPWRLWVALQADPIPRALR